MNLISTSRGLSPRLMEVSRMVATACRNRRSPRLKWTSVSLQRLSLFDQPSRMVTAAPVSDVEPEPPTLKGMPQMDSAVL